MLVSFENLYRDLVANDFCQWREQLPQQLEIIFKQREHGKTAEWKSILEKLPDIEISKLDLKKGRLKIGQLSDCNESESLEINTLLKQLHPWRKGPYELFGNHIDTEWRSDWKWDRIQPHLTPLKNRRILDVGCGNGYHMWRMLGEGAKLVIGADPSQFFLVQFHTLKKYAGGDHAIHLLPFKSEELPNFRIEFKGRGFDTVFSMGVLYHRVSPIEHLQELRNFMRDGAELILETLIIEDEDSTVLLPEDRYAKMRNVWFLPSPKLLTSMLKRVGFTNIRVVDINQTSVDEQRKTDWMTFESLSDFLDPEDHNKTIEGYPAPKRAVVICNR